MAKSNDDGSKERSGEPKTPGNWMWYLALIAVLLLTVSVFVVDSTTKQLSYDDLVSLLKNTRYVERQSERLQEGFTGKTVVNLKNRPERMEVSKLTDVKLDKTVVYGTMTYRLIDNGGNEVQAPKTAKFRTRKDDSEKTNEEMRTLLQASNVDWGFSDGPTFMSQYGLLLLILVATILIMMITVRRISGISSPMSFGRSRGRLYAQEDIGITFDDIAGVDEAVEEVREIVDFLRYPDKYQRLGGRIPKGVLLVGPPGTGKTLLAKAIAGEAGVPFFSLSGSDFVEMFVGVGAARVRDMFQQAQAKSPCIIFIDELDALGKSRSNSGSMVGVHDEREQTLNALLVEMDGFDSNIGIIVIAATNRPETLDPALLRRRSI